MSITVQYIVYCIYLVYSTMFSVFQPLAIIFTNISIVDVLGSLGYASVLSSTYITNESLIFKNLNSFAASLGKETAKK